MPKNLVLFSDGTGNSAGKLFKTNVWRLYQAVDLADPPTPDEPRQFAFYDDGVGTSSFKPLAVLGGAFGVGLARNVIDLYVFLCRMYEPGDRIYAFGFSRGAFTIRVLVGLVMSQGILRCKGNEADLERLAADAYRAYRALRFKSANPLVGWLRSGRDLVIRGWNRLRGRLSYADPRVERIGRPEDGTAAVHIAFLGVWDTVDAYGLPVDELTRAIDNFVWPLTMRDYNLNERVDRACHALALDDERNAFHPRLWNEKPDPQRPGTGVYGGNRETTELAQERISQVWFAGVHANVGGGYADDALAYVSLQWMMQQAHAKGLRFEPTVEQLQQELSDENGRLYDSRHGLAGYYRYNPRRIERLVNTPQVTVERTKVHESVLRRLRAGHDGYAPITLPPGFAVVTMDGRIDDGDAYLRSLPLKPTDPAPPPGPLTGPGSSYERDRELVYNGVWRRRIAYFATLGVTLVLLAMPLFAPGTPACAGRLCFLAAPIRALSVLLPSFASTWTDSFASHPGLFLSLLAALVIGLRAGSALEQRLRDRMRRVWYALPMLRPTAVAGVPAPPAPSAVESLIHGLRNHPAYRASFRALTHGLLPGFFLAGLAYGTWALGSQLVFAARASAGALCPDTALPAANGAKPNGPAPDGSAWFDLRSRCAPTGVQAAKGATYRIRITVFEALRWRDERIPAGPHGFECRLPPAQALTMAAAVPLRRHWTQGWFQPMARIGATGNDSYALEGRPSTAPLHDRCDGASTVPQLPAGCPAEASGPGAVAEVFDSVLVARSSGPLYVYVNDAIGLDFFYRNNVGCARVEVSPVSPQAPLTAP